jgi:hypothetical protein
MEGVLMNRSNLVFLFFYCISVRFLLLLKIYHFSYPLEHGKFLQRRLCESGMIYCRWISQFFVFSVKAFGLCLFSYLTIYFWTCIWDQIWHKMLPSISGNQVIAWKGCLFAPGSRTRAGTMCSPENQLIRNHCFKQLLICTCIWDQS